MSLPTINGTAKLLDDPELRFSPAGVAICKMRLVFNSRKLNQQTNQWEDADSFFVDAVLFKDAAEKAAESYTRQAEVVVSGRLKTRSYETREGEKRSTTELLVDAIGASTRWDTVTINKMARASAGRAPQSGGEMLARAALGISAEEGVQVATEVARFEMSCHHDHDEVGQ
jgi:single-strand DNA-binding protein